MKKLLAISITALLLTACQQANQPNPSASTDSQAPASSSHADMHHDMNHDMHASTASATHGDMAHGGHKHVDLGVASTPAPALRESVYLVEGNWKNQDDQPFKLDTLQGKKQVVAFIYTNCNQVCPIMMKTMIDLQKKLPEDVRAKTGFLVVSFDPERDSPKVLKNFGEHYKADDKWVFLNGSDDDVRMLANTMNIRYQFAEGGMINHSNVISVLDESGKMIEQAISNSQGEAKIIAAVSK